MTGPDPFLTPQLAAAEQGVLIPEQQTYLQLIRTAEVLSGELAALMETHGLSGKQYNILRAVRRGEPQGLTISRIGEQMTDPRADVTRLLDRLEREDLVERRHDRQDRRLVRVHLKKAGERLLQTLDDPVIAVHRQQLGHLAAEELDSLSALLVKARRRA